MNCPFAKESPDHLSAILEIAVKLKEYLRLIGYDA